MEEAAPILMPKSKQWLANIFFRIDGTSGLYSEIVVRLTICISLPVQGEHT